VLVIISVIRHSLRAVVHHCFYECLYGMSMGNGVWLRTPLYDIYTKSVITCTVRYEIILTL